MAILLDPRSTVEYVLKADRSKPAEEQTVWHLKVLNPDDEAAIEDQVGSVVFDAEQVSEGKTGSAQWKSNSSQLSLKILDMGLMGVTNLRNKAGEVEQMPPAKTVGNKRKLDREFLQRIKPFRKELADAVMDVNTISDEEKQNLK